MDALTPEALDAILRFDFLAFLEKVFATLNPGEEFFENWHLEVLAHHLDRVIEGTEKRLIINVPPRSLKSITVSVALPAFLLGHYPNHKIIAASYGQDLAAKLSRDTRAVMESNWYKRIFPGTVIQGKDSETNFETSAHGSRYATSVGGPLTGLGADMIIIDDPQKADDASSEASRKKTKEWFEQTVSTRLNNKNNGVIILVMQRLHEDDLTGHLLEQGGWTHLSIPAIAPIDRDYRVGDDPDDLVRFSAGSVIDARRESEQTLKSIEKAMGSRAFSAQYLQSPIPADGNLLEWKWFRFYEDEKFPLTAFRYVLQSWDPASSESSGADYSVCTTAGIDAAGNIYLVDVWRGRCNFPDLIDRAMKLEEKFKPDGIVGENVGSGQAFCQELRKRLGHRVQTHAPNKSKILRAEAITPSLERGKVFLRHGAPWLEGFRNEVIGFPAGKHDDQVDSMVQLIANQERLINRCRYLGLCRARGMKAARVTEIEVPVPAGPGRLVSYSTRTIKVEVVDP